MAGFDASQVPAAAIAERHLAATGPGGQNVNKVATAVQLRVDAAMLGLEPRVMARLAELAGSRMNSAGVLVITARRHRTQEANRSDAMARAVDLIARAHERPAFRVRTRPSRAAKAKRMESKGVRGVVKKLRGRPELD